MSKLDIMTTKELSFHKLCENKKITKKRKEVAEALLLALEPMTSAMLENWCLSSKRFNHLRRCTITGRFHELEKFGVIAVFKTAPCQVTGSTAKYYTVVEGWL